MEQPNLDYIKELAAGDVSFEQKLIQVVKTELPDEVAFYELNMKNNAFTKAAENVHKLKHKLGIVGLVEGYELAISYEEELKLGKNDLKEQFDAVLLSVVHFINDL